MKAHKKDPAVVKLRASWLFAVTSMVHGKAGRRQCQAVNAILFSDLDPRTVEPSAFDLLAQEIPTARVPEGDGLSLVDAGHPRRARESKSEARRAIEQGGIYVNQQRVKDPARGRARRLAQRWQPAAAKGKRTTPCCAPSADMFHRPLRLALAAGTRRPENVAGHAVCRRVPRDLLWPVFLLLGWSRRTSCRGRTPFLTLWLDSIPISHSLITLVGWAPCFAYLYRVRTGDGAPRRWWHSSS